MKILKCPSTTIKIINFLIKRVKFTNKFFSVYGDILRYLLHSSIINVIMFSVIIYCNL